MSRALLREENRLLRKQLEDFRQGIKEPVNLKVETEWRRAGEEMCGHVGIKPNPKTFMKWIRDRYEAPSNVIAPTNPTVGTFRQMHDEAVDAPIRQNTVQGVRADDLLRMLGTLPMNIGTGTGAWNYVAPVEAVAIAN